jgi:anaphase-promoting complex subunit 1
MGSPKAPKVDQQTLETCIDVAALCLAMVMAGTGNLRVLRVLRKLHLRLDPSPGGLAYGNHMAMSMAVGFLFLGAGARTFSTNNEAVAALLISVFPRFPTATSDNRCHLQVRLSLKPAHSTPERKAGVARTGAVASKTDDPPLA